MPNPAKLTTIARGGIEPLFDRALQQVVDNVKDVNTDPKKSRRIVITLKCTPYPDRSGVQISASIETKLQSPDGVEGTIFIGKEGGRNRAYTQDIKQGDLFPADKTDDDEDEDAPAQPIHSAQPN